MRILHTSAAALLAGVLVAGLASCGGTGPTTAGAKPAATAAATPTPEAFPREFTPEEFMDHVIAAQLEAGSMRSLSTIEMDGAEQFSFGFSMVIDNGDGNPGMIVGVRGDGQTAEVNLVGGQVYVKIDSVTGDSYVQVDPDDVTNPLYSAVAQFMDADPIGQAEDVRDAVTAVELIGEDLIDSHKTGHYRVTLDPAKVTGATAEGLGAAVLAGGDIVHEYWIDNEGRPLQTVVETETDGHIVNVTMKMAEWGQVPPIAPPSADQITTLEALGLA